MHSQTCGSMALAVALIVALGPEYLAPGQPAQYLVAARPGRVPVPPPRPDDLFVCAPVGPGQVMECVRL